MVLVLGLVVVVVVSYLEVRDVLVPDLTGGVGQVGPHYGQSVGDGQQVGLLGGLACRHSGPRYGLRYRTGLQSRYLAVQEGCSVSGDLLIFRFE